MTPNNPTPGDELVERLTPFYDFINEPWRGRGDIEPMDVREYRHELNRKWEPLCRFILEALRTRDAAARSSTTEVERLREALREIEHAESKEIARRIARAALQSKDHSHAG